MDRMLKQRGEKYVTYYKADMHYRVCRDLYPVIGGCGVVFVCYVLQKNGMNRDTIQKIVHQDLQDFESVSSQLLHQQKVEFIDGGSMTLYAYRFVLERLQLHLSRLPRDTFKLTDKDECRDFCIHDFDCKLVSCMLIISLVSCFIGFLALIIHHRTFEECMAFFACSLVGMVLLAMLHHTLNLAQRNYSSPWGKKQIQHVVRRAERFINDCAE